MLRLEIEDEQQTEKTLRLALRRCGDDVNLVALDSDFVQDGNIHWSVILTITQNGCLTRREDRPEFMGLQTDAEGRIELRER